MTLRVDRVGITTVQDLGRRGWAHVGVPRSGAADRTSHRLANRLVGNPPGAATIETSGGLVLTALDDCVVVVAGAECEASVDGRAVAQCRSTRVPSGATLRVNRLVSGVRAYLAVAGGIHGEALLGSLSHDTLSGIVPVPLAGGTTLVVGSPTGTPTGLDVPITPRDDRVLRVDPVPQAAHAVPQLDARSVQIPVVVSSTADRIGVRLRGYPASRAAGGELASVPLVRGAVQLTPENELVVMLADHPTTGGYPVIGVMQPDDVDLLAQTPSGSGVVLVR